jgi:hypothetical protein
VGGRDTPGRYALPLARLRASGELLEIDAQQLSFRAMRQTFSSTPCTGWGSSMRRWNGCEIAELLRSALPASFSDGAQIAP